MWPMSVRLAALLLFAALLSYLAGLSSPPAHAGMLIAPSQQIETRRATCSDNATDSVVWMNNYNLTVLGNLTRAGNVQGRTFVGGNVTQQESADFGTSLHGPSSTCTGTTLAAGGNISNGNPFQIFKGDVQYGGTNARNYNFNNSQGCSAQRNSSLTPSAVTHLETAMLAFSAQLAGYPANNADPVVNASNNLVFAINTISPDGLAVFDVTAMQAYQSGAGGDIDIVDNVGATTILINVRGATVNWGNGGMGKFFTTQNGARNANIMWNYPDATNITFSPAHYGAILAPKAALQANNMLTGSVVVKTYSGQGQVRQPEFGLDNIPPLTGNCTGTPAISLKKYTQGEDANSTPGPLVPVGSTVTWLYSVINSGETPLRNITMTDNMPGVTPVYVSGDLNNNGILEVTEIWHYQATGTATAGQYTNTGSVTATAPDNSTVQAQDISHYFGSNPQINIEKSTNGEDADTVPGPLLLVGSPVTWEYVITNGGNVPLGNLVVSDSQGVTPLYIQGDSNNDSMLDTGETWIYRATATAIEGQYTNNGFVTGTPQVGADVSDEDASHYFGVRAAIDVQKHTNGVDADVPTGPIIRVGDPVTWTYIVENRGNITLTNVTVTDNPIQAITCPQNSLAPGGAMTCEATGNAALGQYANMVTVVGTTPLGSVVTDQDSSHYFGAQPSLVIKKYTNGEDADTIPGPTLTEGEQVKWTYMVTNTGNVPLEGLVVTDSEGEIVSCPRGLSSEGGSVTCQAFGIAQLGQYTNTGTATASFQGEVITDDDLSHYEGLAQPPPPNPSIQLVKLTNGLDANTPEEGPDILAGTTVTWTYLIYNTGNVPLNSISLSDSDPNVTPAFVDGDTNNNNELDLGELWRYRATDDAIIGPYSNTGQVTGTPPTGPNVSDDDDSNYFGAQPSIVLKKFTNGADADTEPGPFVLVGDDIVWTYIVTNTGNVPLVNIKVTDDQDVLVTCPTFELDPGEGTTCQGNEDVAVAGQYGNTGTVTALPTAGSTITASDDSHYYGVLAGIEIRKLTNGVHAVIAPGPFIPVGEDVTWTYIVTNASNITLTGVAVTDSDIDLSVDCPPVTLAPAASISCDATGSAIAGAYDNRADVTGIPPGGLPTVTAFDLSHYYGSQPGIAIKKFTNGEDADTPPGPFLSVGEHIHWTYIVTNTGNVNLSNVGVTDSEVQEVNCAQTSLAPGKSMICLAAGNAAPGQYENTGTATGTPPVGSDVTGEDLSHYFGSEPSIVVKKFTNGQDADTLPGPFVPDGNTVTWSYVVTNTGNVTLTDVVVLDTRIDLKAACIPVTLPPGESMSCAATGIATIGQYTNTAFVAGDPPGNLPQVTDSNLSHYFGEQPSLAIKVYTNGDDANSAPGPFVLVGDEVEWTYVVTNTGNVLLIGVTVNDNRIGDVTCPDTELDPGEVMTCSATGTAVINQYENIGEATGTSPSGAEVSANDPSHYFGAQPGLVLQKYVNGQDADIAPGLTLDVGEIVIWTYIVTNTGNVPLAITVTDDQGEDVRCTREVTFPGEQHLCQAFGTAQVGQYTNVGTASATVLGTTVTATDASNYFGQELPPPSEPSIDIKKFTNGVNAVESPGPFILVDQPVQWTYVVANRGDVTLIDVTVTDDKVGPVDCPRDTLDPDEFMICTAGDSATLGEYVNEATATGTSPQGEDASDTDISRYFGIEPAIDIKKYTNGVDADTPTGPIIRVGDPVTWTYRVTNRGNITLTTVIATDNAVEDMDCTRITLAPGEVMTCTAFGTAVSGQYSNTVTVVATPPIGPGVTDQDISHYFGAQPSLLIKKYTNGEDADVAPGPVLNEGERVIWTYVVTNTGNVPLADLVVNDGEVEQVACQREIVPVGSQVICDALGTAQLGQYVNTGIATATFMGETLMDDDPSHYFGHQSFPPPNPQILLLKLTNGLNADTPEQGPDILVGTTVTWTYVVFNTGNVPLNNIAVSDSDAGVTPLLVSGDTNNNSVLNLGEVWFYRATSTAIAGPYANTGDVSGTPPSGPAVSDDDDSHYFGAQPSIAFKKYTNSVDADSAPGPFVPVGDEIVWTYIVTNTGNVLVTGISVTDDQGDQVTCPTFELNPGEATACQGDKAVAQPGQYRNTGTVVVTPPVGPNITTNDDSHYFGTQVGVEITKLTNGQHIDAPPGLFVPVGDEVTWRYIVTNTSNVTLNNVTVTDDQIDLRADCPAVTLTPGASMSCDATAGAVAGQHANIATVAGTPPGGLSPVTDEDRGYYFGSQPDIAIKKFTNGEDADTPPGPFVPVGEEVVWTYFISNTGNVRLSLLVNDDRVGSLRCPRVLLVPGSTIICSATGSAEAGQYTNTGIVTGTSPSGIKVVNIDSSYYFGAQPGIAIKTYTNGEDADSPPGPVVRVGEDVTWSYVVTNTGNMLLSNVRVEDDQIGDIDCPKTTLTPGEVMTCATTAPAEAGQYANTGTVVGTPTEGGLASVTDQDPSHYFGAQPAFVLKKYTNGQDADSAPGPILDVGEIVVWSYIVTNTGNVPLAITVTDDQGASIRCPRALTVPGGQQICQAFGFAQAGQYQNVGTATATYLGESVTATDTSHYVGQELPLPNEPRIDIKKLTNGVDATTIPGTFVVVGEPVEWTYIVVNRGNVELSDVTVTDDQIGAVSCPQSTLGLRQSMVCTATGTATPGQYTNTATTIGTAPDGAEVSAEAINHYYGVGPAITIKKYTNGVDADIATGPIIDVGDPVQWSYVVTNTGNVALDDVFVTDNPSEAITCPQTSLQTGEMMTCSASGIAATGQQANIATAVATPPLGGTVTDQDASHYFGAQPQLVIKKYTNGQDANFSPGPELIAGHAVVWTYIVTNTGNVPLDDLRVSDSEGEEVSCQRGASPVGGVVVCHAFGIARPTQYRNVGIATATFMGEVVSDEDPSNYEGQLPAPSPDPDIQIVKSTNGLDATTPAEGPDILAGTTVTWTYRVINTGGVPLNNVTVSDSDATVTPLFVDGDTNNNGLLDRGELWRYRATGTALVGPYTNTGSVEATSPTDVTVTDEDNSYYFGAHPSIALKKYTNGEDADSEPGPLVAVGEAVFWTYVVTNNGNVPLINIAATDDQGINVTCPAIELDPNEAMTCLGDEGVAQPGQHGNIGAVTATPPIGADVTATDASHYYGEQIEIEITKFTNGELGTDPPGPFIPVGDEVTWTYIVTNTSNVTLNDVTVTDNRVDLSTACPPVTLAPGESMNCAATGNAEAGQYANTATVAGTSAGTPGVSGLVGIEQVGVIATADDISHYFGVDAQIDIETLTNGEDADQPPGPTLEISTTVIWSYQVTNTGNVDLTNIVVNDDQIGNVPCPQTELAVGESMTCTATGTARVGQYTNVGQATGTTAEGIVVADEDPSYYLGNDPTDLDVGEQPQEQHNYFLPSINDGSAEEDNK